MDNVICDVIDYYDAVYRSELLYRRNDYAYLTRIAASRLIYRQITLAATES